MRPALWPPLHPRRERDRTALLATITRAGLGLLAAGLAVGGCATAAQPSAGNFHGEARSIAQTVDDLASAGTGHDAAKVCKDLLARALVARLAASRGGCKQAVQNQIDETDSFDVTVVSGGVRVTGATAVARVKSVNGGHDHLNNLTLVREGGRWRISGLGG